MVDLVISPQLKEQGILFVKKTPIYVSNKKGTVYDEALVQILCDSLSKNYLKYNGYIKPLLIIRSKFPIYGNLEIIPMGKYHKLIKQIYRFISIGKETLDIKFGNNRIVYEMDGFHVSYSLYSLYLQQKEDFEGMLRHYELAFTNNSRYFKSITYGRLLRHIIDQLKYLVENKSINTCSEDEFYSNWAKRLCEECK